MSFPKAKIKRFNDIPVLSSPFLEKKDKKDCKSTGKDKEKEHKDEKLVDKIPTKSLSSEKDHSKSSFRLFRTPSLPRRLRFRNNSDLTPSKSSQKAAAEAAQIVAEINARATALKDKEALAAAHVEIKNKSEIILENESVIEELKREKDELENAVLKLKDEKDKINTEKMATIQHLEHRIESINQADEMIKRICENSLNKINQLNDDIRKLSRDHELETFKLMEEKSDLELKIEKLACELSNAIQENSNLQENSTKMNVEINNLKSVLNEQKLEIKNHELGFESLLAENVRLIESMESVQKQSEDDMIAYVEESKNLFDEIAKYKEINIDLQTNLEMERSAVEQLRNEINELQQKNENMEQKFEKQILLITEQHEMKIKELESVFILEKSKLQKEHNEELSEMDINHLCEMEKLTDLNEEKIRISEVQFEEKLKLLESSLVNSIEQERIMWKNEIDKCQKIAENEIMQSEFEKRDLKELLDCANDLVRDKDHRIEELENRIKQNIDNTTNLHEQCQINLDEAKKECSRIMTEKYNYQLTLNNTRSTVNILMERLKKSDTDVETLKVDLEKITASKNDLQSHCQQLSEEIAILKGELDEYQTALSALKYSSEKLEHEMKNQENVFETIMMSEEETLQTVDKIGKLFDAKIEENISKYFDMYNELKRKYDHRESYIKDMKTLLDEFVTGIEVARLEIESKNLKLNELEQESKDIKLENMTLKFKLEQFEQYEQHNHKRARTNTPEIPDDNETEIISHVLLENIINHLENDTTNEITTSEEKDILNDFLIRRENEYVQENQVLKHQIDELENKLKMFGGEQLPKFKNTENLKESNMMLKNKILELTSVTHDQERKINELKEKLLLSTDKKTPIKNKIGGVKHGTPKTPKTPKTPIKMYSGKENLSPAPGIISSPVGILRTRNN